ncbi:MAG: hypothetical protein UT55_C0049G0006 [Candidatus Peregrinibacteria bacterium GW2011_GWE2_39_6]|nr:MAG: hypothetical protein UT36_C0003G0077 [Candidatus Peregrinibacteria bacterium GW2011_GWF2_39_17]KKR25130.1 MAG: hypothetical protein UT55_C0049G0006 [Candidatus Peregrinibacteria bacterium GW2011_GWE2_39_6]HCW31961.1 hypothetical protein [Candidatus Peregrinibacteria bacterium]
MNYFQQFEQLRLQTPHIGLQCVQNENSPFCQYTEKSRNCYMTFASYQSEDCYYNHRIFYCKDCVDCTLCNHCELCYGCVDCVKSYNCNHCGYCEQAIDSDFCFYCIGVQNCFGCVGLRQKQFYILNQPFTVEEYEKRIIELRKLPISQIYQMIAPLIFKTPRAAMYGKKNEDSYGENIHQCKNVYWGFDSKQLRDCAYVYHCDESTDLWDCSHLGWSEQCYQIMSGGNLNNCCFCYGCWYSSNLEYCELVYSSHDCFLCVGLNHAEYCILNKPFPKEVYFQKIAEIREAMKRDGTLGKWFSATYPEVITYGL